MPGLGGLNGNLHDRLLICVHYKKMDSGSLQPCAAHFSQKLNAPENNDRYKFEYILHVVMALHTCLAHLLLRADYQGLMRATLRLR